MGQKVQSKEVNGATWTVTQFPAGKGVKMLTFLVKLAGPSLISMLGSLKGGKGLLDADIDSTTLSTAVTALAERLDEDLVLSKVKSLLELTRKDGIEVAEQFDLVFQGDYLTLVKVLTFVLEVNYGSFFAGSGTDAKESQASKEA